MQIKDLENKNIIIWGMGTEGIAVKNYLTKHKLAKNIYEYNDSDGQNILEELAKKSDVVIRSPGVSIYKPEFAMLKKYGLEITSSSNIFLSEMKQRQTKVIGVSGSKGKTLSVSMMYHMMKGMGLKVALGGNIGKALIELIDEENDYIIGEFSSYQASDIKNSPNIVMFTNLFSVHTDWHQGHEGYCRDKVHLAHKADVAVVNSNNPELIKYTESLPNIVYYGKANGFYAKDKELFYQDEVVCNIDNLQINGNHNMENLAGVMTVIKTLGLDWRKALSFLPSFEQVAHRLQDVGVIDGVRFINDSISTAPEAAISAMKSFDNNMVIISGGTINQQDYTEYAKFIEANPKVKIAITLFQCGSQIADSIRKYVTRDDFVLIEAEKLSEAVDLAFKGIKLAKGNLVLFSPTAPSFGYYKNFMERGQDFINCVKKLAK
ncbi:MAG: UDP-N-acetylmuramoyl-L-alanine--D-glutamate ligase [Alphaproteobacteria bacterium]|nr:UDP-N-acetylmuramoyl-L-alanine--D-glutamate ligase [Alphaproteobacteria bacterium]